MEKLSSILSEKFEVVIAPRWKTKGYTAIANKIILNSSLSAGARIVYCALLIRCFQKDLAYPSYETIGKDTGFSRKSVYNYLKELKEKVLIKVKRRRNKTNVYILKF
jgi:hypothetical protein